MSKKIKESGGRSLSTEQVRTLWVLRRIQISATIFMPVSSLIMFAVIRNSQPEQFEKLVYILSLEIVVATIATAVYFERVYRKRKRQFEFESDGGIQSHKL